MRKWKRSGDRLARHSGATRSLRPRQQNDSIIAQANSCRQIRWIAGSAGACRWLRLSLPAGSAKLLGNQRLALLAAFGALPRSNQRFAACCDCQPSALSLPASASPLRSALRQRFAAAVSASHFAPRWLREAFAPRQRFALRADRSFALTAAFAPRQRFAAAVSASR